MPLPDKPKPQPCPKIALNGQGKPRKRAPGGGRKPSAVPVTGGSINRIIRDESVKNRPDTIERRWDAIQAELVNLPSGWTAGVVAYPVYRKAESIQRFRSKNPTRGRKAAPPSDKKSTMSWLEFAHELPDLELIERYKMSRQSGLMVQRRFNREGFRLPSDAADLKPHAYRRANADEIAALPPTILKMLEKVASLIGVRIDGPDLVAKAAKAEAKSLAASKKIAKAKAKKKAEAAAKAAKAKTAKKAKGKKAKK